jgi:hypothetical protein
MRRILVVAAAAAMALAVLGPPAVQAEKFHKASFDPQDQGFTVKAVYTTERPSLTSHYQTVSSEREPMPLHLAAGKRSSDGDQGKRGKASSETTALHIGARDRNPVLNL